MYIDKIHTCQEIVSTLIVVAELIVFIEPRRVKKYVKYPNTYIY